MEMIITMVEPITQLEHARAGNTTPEMIFVANREQLEPELIRKEKPAEEEKPKRPRQKSAEAKPKAQTRAPKKSETSSEGEAEA